jgi:hypothetical protein
LLKVLIAGKATAGMPLTAGIARTTLPSRHSHGIVKKLQQPIRDSAEQKHKGADTGETGNYPAEIRLHV